MLQMSTRYGCFVVVVALAHSPAVSAGEDRQVRSMFSRFSGVCQTGVDANRPIVWNHLSAIRNGLSWSAVQPGGRIVLAIHLAKENDAAIFTDWEGSGDNMHLDWPSTRMTVTLTELSASDVRRAGRVGIYGSKRPLDVVSTGDGVSLSVPVMDEDAEERADNRASPVTTFYVVVERAAAGEGE